eukprot:Rmarinus@m.22099
MPIHPEVKWAQFENNRDLLLTICVEDIRDDAVTFEDEKVIFSGHGADGKEYYFEIDLYKPIDCDKCKCEVHERNTKMTLVKKEDEEWPRLQKSHARLSFLGHDFSRIDDDGHCYDVSNPRSKINL